MGPMRTCSKCGESKDETAYYRLSGKTSLRGECKTCHKLTSTRNIKKRSLVYSHRKRLVRVGLTQEEFERLVIATGQRCCICGRKAEAIDHDHATGRVRGLLCHRCNRCIGAFGDSVDTLQRAINYLLVDVAFW